MLQGNSTFLDLAAALTEASSAASLATSLGIVLRATAEAEEEAMVVVDMAEEDTVEGQAVEEVEV